MTSVPLHTQGKRRALDGNTLGPLTPIQTQGRIQRVPGRQGRGAEIPEGSTILDLGCGAGLDTFMAARGTDPSGRVTGIDFSGSMLDRAERAPQETGLTNVEFHGSPAERLPVKDGEVDVVIVNGIFNLNPNRGAIFSELAGGGGTPKRSRPCSRADPHKTRHKLSVTRGSRPACLNKRCQGGWCLPG